MNRRSDISLPNVIRGAGPLVSRGSWWESLSLCAEAPSPDKHLLAGTSTCPASERVLRLSLRPQSSTCQLTFGKTPLLPQIWSEEGFPGVHHLPLQDASGLQLRLPSALSWTAGGQGGLRTQLSPPQPVSGPARPLLLTVLPWDSMGSGTGWRGLGALHWT